MSPFDALLEVPVNPFGTNGIAKELSERYETDEGSNREQKQIPCPIV